MARRDHSPGIRRSAFSSKKGAAFTRHFPLDERVARYETNQATTILRRSKGAKRLDASGGHVLDILPGIDVADGALLDDRHQPAAAERPTAQSPLVPLRAGACRIVVVAADGRDRLHAF